MKTKYPVIYEGHPTPPVAGDMLVWGGLEWVTVNEENILYTHPKGFTNAPDASLAPDVVISKILVNNEGHVTGVDTRVLTPANIGAATEDHIHLLTNLEGGSNKMFWSDNSGNVQEIDQGAEGQILMMDEVNSKPIWATPPSESIFDYGVDGLVPGPTLGGAGETRFLRADGNWVQVGSEGIADVNLSIGTHNASSLEIDNDGGDNVTLPGASSSLSGLLTANTQTIGGAKTFNHDTTFNNAIYITDGWRIVQSGTAASSADRLNIQQDVNGSGNWQTIFIIRGKGYGNGGQVDAPDFKLREAQ